MPTNSQQAPSTDPLLTPLQVGDLLLPNRIVMAPLTRCRAAEGRVPTELMAEYYAQRATYGLILSEATAICPMGVGYPDTPGIWNDAQTKAWSQVTRAVHSAGGRIILQLWHVGRISDPAYLDGATPVSSSAVQPHGHVSLLRPKRPFVTPRALETSEIPGVVQAYRDAASRARDAGFDGVELHSANGYLFDQFLQDSINRRTDAYGGPIENRARLLLEATDALLTVWPAGRVGVHIAPRCEGNGMGDSDPAALFSYVARELGQRRIAFLCARESHDPSRTPPPLGPQLKREFGGVFIANEGFSADSARTAIQSGHADAIAWGRAAIANPDLPARIRHHIPWNEADPATFYGGGTPGYTDYPSAPLPN